MSAFPVTSFRLWRLFFFFRGEFGRHVCCVFQLRHDCGSQSSLWSYGISHSSSDISPGLLFSRVRPPGSAGNGEFLMEANQQISCWDFNSAVTCNCMWQTQVGNSSWCHCTFAGGIVGMLVGGFWLVLDRLASAGTATCSTPIQPERASNEPLKPLLWEFQPFLCSDLLPSWQIILNHLSQSKINFLKKTKRDFSGQALKV